MPEAPTINEAIASGLLTVSAAAAAAGITSKTLRWYESVGLVVPERTVSGYRIYRQAHVERARLVAGLLNAGITSREIGDLLRIAQHGPRSRAEQTHALEKIKARTTALLELYNLIAPGGRPCPQTTTAR